MQPRKAREAHDRQTPKEKENVNTGRNSKHKQTPDLIWKTQISGQAVTMDIRQHSL